MYTCITDEDRRQTTYRNNSQTLQWCNFDRLFKVIEQKMTAGDGDSELIWCEVLKRYNKVSKSVQKNVSLGHIIFIY